MTEYIDGLHGFLTIHQDAYLMVVAAFLTRWLISVATTGFFGRR